MNILIISQNKESSAFLRRFLASAGHDALCISGSANAVQEVVKQRPDLIIIEIVKPELPAIAIVNSLQQNSVARCIPVIVISDCPELEVELLHLYDFISKPLDLYGLRESVDTLACRVKNWGDAAQIGLLSSEEHQRFNDYLTANIGIYFESHNLKMLERGLKSRMSALRIKKYDEYYNYLGKNLKKSQELQKLLQLLVVDETYFFRYFAHFSALMKQVLPDIATARKKIRLWSAGCSTGEEPYSIAMAIMEIFPDWRSRDIRILATDINNRALKQAREGIYSSWKIRVTEKQYLAKYFKNLGDSYVVNDDVKSLVDFDHLNLRKANSSSDRLSAEQFDVIFCRNVMIYFTPEVTEKIVESFASSLRPGGYLFLGHSETLAYISTNFERQLHDRGYFYRKRFTEKQAAANPPMITPPAAAAKTEIRLPVQKPLSSTEAAAKDYLTLYEKGVAQMEAGRFVEAGNLFREVLERAPDHTAAILGAAFIHANSGMCEVALDDCNRALLIDDLQPEAYYVRGLVFERIGREGDSLQEYRKAILLNMDFVMPHYRLGKLHIRAGEHKSGARHLKNSVKLLEKVGRETIIPFSGGVTSEVFLERIREEIHAAELMVKSC